MRAGYTPSFPHFFSQFLMLPQCDLYLPVIMAGDILRFLQPHSRWNICFLSLVAGWLYKGSIYVVVTMRTLSRRSWVVDSDVFQGLSVCGLPRSIWLGSSSNEFSLQVLPYVPSPYPVFPGGAHTGFPGSFLSLARPPSWRCLSSFGTNCSQDLLRCHSDTRSHCSLASCLALS